MPLGIVRVRAARPGAVGELVVVQRGDDRDRSMERLDVGVAVVLPVARPVLVERAALAERIEVAADAGPGRLALGRDVGGLVDVVAEVEQEVEVVALGDPPVGVEVARVVLRAGAGREAQPIGVGAQRPGAARRRDLSRRREAVVVEDARLEAGNVDVDRVWSRSASAMVSPEATTSISSASRPTFQVTGTES
jgi:hypothetical protein